MIKHLALNIFIIFYENFTFIKKKVFCQLLPAQKLYYACNYTPTTKCVGGLYWIRFVASVGRSVGRSVRPSPIRVRFITPLLMKGFPSNLNDTFTSTRGCAEPMLPMCQLNVKVTDKGQIFNKQTSHIMSCPLYNSFTNGRISFKLE